MKSVKSKKMVDFDFDGFRKDIENNIPFGDIKNKYGIRTHIELEGLIYRLSKRDNKMYNYTFQEITRSQPVYESKDGFVKINKKFVGEVKSKMNCTKLEFGGVKYDDNKIIIEVKVA
ncbi:hypothetical protein FACS1894206_09600 [Deltaproteobacteria bacterium]|nr:hypothetical protein FACS1894206_09600 [Deltaproteobacteria bacterium]